MSSARIHVPPLKWSGNSRGEDQNKMEHKTWTSEDQNKVASLIDQAAQNVQHFLREVSKLFVVFMYTMGDDEYTRGRGDRGGGRGPFAPLAFRARLSVRDPRRAEGGGMSGGEPKPRILTSKAWTCLQRSGRLGGGVAERDPMRGENVQAIPWRR